MTQKHQTSEPSPNAYLMYHQDGLQDILIGFVILVIGILILNDSASYMGIWAALLYPFLLMGKKIVTMPRVPLANLPPEREQQRSLMVLFVLGTLTLIGGIAAYFLFSGDGFSFDAGARFIPVIALLIVGGLVVWAWRGGMGRLQLYIALFLIAFFASTRLGLNLPYIIIALGALILLVGLIVLARFLQTHPKLENV